MHFALAQNCFTPDLLSACERGSRGVMRSSHNSCLLTLWIQAQFQGPQAYDVNLHYAVTQTGSAAVRVRIRGRSASSLQRRPKARIRVSVRW